MAIGDRKEHGMRVVENDSLLPPGVCHLCRGAASEGTKMVDTLKTFVTGFPTGVEGRMYVCESCVSSLGEALGLERGDRVVRAETERDLARAELASLRDHIIDTAKALEAGSMDLAQGEAPAVVAAASEVAAPAEAEVPAAAVVEPASE